MTVAESALGAETPEALPSIPPKLGTGVRVAYGFGSLASGISATVLGGSVLQLYFNQVIGLPAAWVGAAIMVTILIDAVTDPLIGRFSDNLRSRWGRRHILMYASAVPSAAGVLAMWHAPASLGPAGLLVFMVGMLLFVRVATSFYDIPARALGPELAPDYHDRTALVAWRFVFGIAGSAVMSAVLYQVFLREDAANPLGVLNRERYAEFGVLAAGVIFAAIIVSSLATHSRIRHLHVPPKERQGFAAAMGDLKASLVQPALLSLLFATLLNGFGGGLQFGVVVYVALNFWELKPQEYSFILLSGPFASLLALWAAPRLSARFGKRPFMLACYLGWLLLFIAPYLARSAGLTPPAGTVALVALLVAFEFVALAFAFGVHVVLNSMLADAADDVAVKTGRRSEGVLFAAYGLLDKLGIALGSLAAGLVLAFVAFPTGAVPGTVDARIVNTLVLIAIPTVAMCNVVAMGLISRFRLDQAQHERNLAELRRQEAARAMRGEV